jgi:hypothetical protein
VYDAIAYTLYVLSKNKLRGLIVEHDSNFNHFPRSGRVRFMLVLQKSKRTIKITTIMPIKKRI